MNAGSAKIVGGTLLTDDCSQLMWNAFRFLLVPTLGFRSLRAFCATPAQCPVCGGLHAVSPARWLCSGGSLGLKHR